MADNDGAKVGSGYIEVTAKVDRKGAEREMRRALEGAVKETQKQLNKTLSGLPNTASQAIRGYQKGGNSQLKEIAAEASRAKALDRERQRAFEQQIANVQRLMKFREVEQKRVEALGKAEGQAYAIERARIEAIGKAERQAYAEDARRTAALDALRQKARDKELADLKALAKAHEIEQDRKISVAKAEFQAYAMENARREALAKAEAQRLEMLGKAEHQAYAEDERRTRALMKAANSRATSNAIDNISHSLSQLSTRIGIASFQLQLLGGMTTLAIAAPVGVGFGALTKGGLEFASSIGYARASMEALLGPTADVEGAIRDITQMAIDSPLFNTEDAISYAQKLASVKIKGEDLYKTMQALSNIMLTQGVAGPERANLAMMAYTQILSKGAIGMDDLRQQFAEHVPGGMLIFQEVAKRMGYKTIKLLSEAMKDGEVTAAELNAEFIEFGNTARFLEGANKAARTLGGTWQAFKEEMQSTVGLAFDRNRAEIIKAIEGIRPVVRDFIDWFVGRIPGMLMWLNRTVATVRAWKAAYDALSPAQKELIGQVSTFLVLMGPVSVALGVVGTTISAVLNGLSLFTKVLALAGSGAASAISTFTGIGAAVIALAAGMTYLYRTSEPFRKVFLQVMNRLKDYVVMLILPLVDLLVGAWRSLGRTFEDLGFKTEHLAYLAGLLVIPLVMLQQTLIVLWVAIKAVQAVVLVLSAGLYALLHVVSYLLWAIQQLAQGLSHLPGDTGKRWEGVAESIEGVRKEMEGFVDVGPKWKNLTETGSDATDGLAKSLKDTDFTVTGLSSHFDIFGNGIESLTKKEISLEEAITNARNAMASQASIAMSARDASDNYQQSLLSLEQAVKQNGKTLNSKSEAGQRNIQMLKNAAMASHEMMLQDIRSGVPHNEAIERHKKRAAALQKEFGKSKETRKAAAELIATYGRVPKNVRTLLETMGYKDVNAKLLDLLAKQRAGKNGTDFAYEKRRQKKLNAMEGFATGGLISGPGGPTSDKIPILASNREFMIRASSVRSLGVEALEYINRYGALPLSAQYAKGGLVEKWPFPVSVKDFQIPELIGGGPNVGALGVSKMMSILWKRFPGLPLISGYRPGSITSTGNLSYHAMNRAVDIPPIMEVFNWISSNYGKGTKELIFTPAGGRQIKNGQPHTFTGGTIQEDHYDHVHWAYDNGGYVAPGIPFINKTGASELMLNSAQAAALETKIANSDRPVYVSVYVDGVRRDAEIVYDEKTEQLIRALGGV